MKGHSSGVYALHAGMDSSTLFSGSGDNMVAEWSLVERKPQRFSVNVGTTVYSVLYIPERDLLLIGQMKGGIHVIDMKARKEIHHLKAHERGVYHLAYHPEEGHFYAAGGDGNLTVWSLDDFSLIITLPVCEEKLRRVAVSLDGKWVAVAAGDGTIPIYETGFYNEMYRLRSHPEGASSLTWHPNGKWLVTGGKDAHIRFWYIQEHFRQVRAIPAHRYTIYDIVFSPCGRWAASASRDKTVKIWDANTFDPLKKMDVLRYSDSHTHSVNALFWSPHDNLLVTAGDDRDLILWKISDRDPEG